MFYGMNAWFLATLSLGALGWTAMTAHPAWARLEAHAAARAHAAAWARGGPVVTIVSLASAALGLAAARSEPDMKWAVGAGFVAASLAFQWLVMAGPGRALARAGEAPDAPEAGTRALLRRWGWLHMARAGLVAAGVFFFIWAAH